MKETRLGEFEEVIMLLVGILGDEQAYALKIADEFKSQTGRAVSIGAVHSTLSRLEDKGFLSLSDGRQYAVDLLSTDGQHVKIDSVELIETSPEARLCQAFIDLAHSFVVHLIRAIEDHHILPKRISQILGGFCLACSGWTCRRSSKKHPQCLGECDVTNVRQRSDDQSLFDSQVFKGILKVNIADGDDDCVLLLSPVKPALFQPLKICRIFDFLLDQIFC